MNTETELKLRMKPDELGRLRRHPLLRELRLSSPRTRKLRNVYFDTDDLALRKNRIALRVRHDGEHRIQTVKTPENGAGGAAHRYREYETPIGGDRPELELIQDGTIREALPVSTPEDLKEAFVSDITRSTTPLELEDSKIELAVDTGEIATPHAREEVCEAELELKSGPPARLYELALRLHENVPFTVEYRSKAARGYDLLLGQKPRPSKSQAIELAPTMTAWDAFVAVARECLRQLRANEDCARLGEDSEGVHQLRVGLRRLRAAFSLFAEVLPDEQCRHFVDELRWAQQRLGPARDWDVFIEDTLVPLRERLPGDQTLHALAEAARGAREASYLAVAETLGDRRYTRLQLQLDLWLESGCGQADDDVGRSADRQADQPMDQPADRSADRAAAATAPWLQPVGDVARAILAKRHRKLRKLAKRFDELDDEARHEMRIRGKKARYAAEFFQSLFRRKAAQKYAKRLSQMQDCLGSMNDAVVGTRLMEELAQADAHGKALADRADDILAGWFAARVAGDMRPAARISRKVAKVKPFWEES